MKLGDPSNGFKADANFNYWGQIEPWLTQKAIEHYPKSLFAQMYRDGKHVWLTSADNA